MLCKGLLRSRVIQVRELRIVLYLPATDSCHIDRFTEDRHATRLQSARAQDDGKLHVIPDLDC